MQGHLASDNVCYFPHIRDFMPLLSHRIMKKEKNAINFPSLFYVEFAKTA
jgi:hypothetical protein